MTSFHKAQPLSDPIRLCAWRASGYLQYGLLRDFIKIYDVYVNDPIKGDFQKTLLLFHICRKSFVEYE